jgi:stress response protein YsnF
VPTRCEEVTIEHVPGQGEVTEAKLGEDEVSVSVTEEVVVEKRPVAKEEVRIRKDVVEDTEIV